MPLNADEPRDVVGRQGYLTSASGVAMKPIIKILLFFVTVSFLIVPRMAWAEESIREAQVWANRAVSSLLLVRGEGHQQEHKDRMQQDLTQARTSLQNAGQQANEYINDTLTTLQTILFQGVNAGPREEDLPWRYPQWLSQALSAFLLATESSLPDDAEGMERVALEFLTVQYLSKSYIGTYELPREHQDVYIGQDEVALVPVIDAYMASEGLSNKDLARWQFIRKALTDLNSRSSTWASVSGKPFVPLMVDYYVRSLEF